MNGNYTNGGDGAWTATWINLLAGIWLIISPWILGFGALQSAMLDTLIVGIVVLFLSLIRLGTPTSAPGVSWFNFVLGLWLIISPFVLASVNPAATVNDVILGIIVAFCALFSALGEGTGSYTSMGSGRTLSR